MITTKTWLASTALAAALLTSLPALAADYKIDSGNAHASINFRIKHLGYSWLTGRFDKFSGSFTYDKADPAASKVSVTIDTSSVDSNLEMRDTHLRSAELLDVAKYPKASFVSTKVEPGPDGTTAKIIGNLTLHGVTKPITIDAKKIGQGKDPWGGYRAGFAGTTQIALKDFGIDFNLGPASKEVYFDLNVEGIRQ